MTKYETSHLILEGEVYACESYNYKKHGILKFLTEKGEESEPAIILKHLMWDVEQVVVPVVLHHPPSLCVPHRVLAAPLPVGAWLEIFGMFRSTGSPRLQQWC